MKNRKILGSLLLILFILINNLSPVFGDSFNSSVVVEPDETLEPSEEIIEIKKEAGATIIAGENQRVTVYESGISVLEYKELDDCDTDVILTPYASRNKISELKVFVKPEEVGLSNHIKEELEEAYESVLEVSTLDELTIEVKEEASKKSVTVEDLVVRDIFDISKRHDGNHHYDPIHNTHNINKIYIKTKTLKNFVCLLHYKEGTWNVVKDVEIIDDKTLCVSVDSLSPFAIVVSNTDVKEKEVEPVEPVEPIEPVEPVEPGHKCGCCIIHILIMITCILTIVISLFVKVKKQDKDKKLSKEEKEKLEKHNKKIRRNRNLIMIINLIICLVLYYFRRCHLDFYALLIDILAMIFFFMFTYRDNDDEKNKQD